MSYKEYNKEYYKLNRQQILKRNKDLYRKNHPIKDKHGRNFTEKEFQDRLKENYGDKIKSLSPYVNFRTKIDVKCNVCGNIWKTMSSRLMRGVGCKNCAVLKQTKNKDEFKNEFIKIYKDKCELLSDYVNAKTKVEVKCKICNNIWNIKPSHILYYKCECPKCSIITRVHNSTKTHDQFIEDVFKIHGEKLTVLDKYINAKTKIKIKCNSCGNGWISAPYSLLNGHGCSYCNLSKGELAIDTFLKNNMINYKRQYTIENCKHKKMLQFDFAVFDVDKLKCLIEYDGIQHFKSFKFFGGDEKLKDLKEKDTIKNDYCKNNGIELNRIPYTQRKNIGKILDSIFHQE